MNLFLVNKIKLWLTCKGVLQRPLCEVFQGSVDGRPQNVEVVICEHWEGSVFLAEVKAAHRGDKHAPRP